MTLSFDLQYLTRSSLSRGYCISVRVIEKSRKMVKRVMLSEAASGGARPSRHDHECKAGQWSFSVFL